MPSRSGTNTARVTKLHLRDSTLKDSLQFPQLPDASPDPILITNTKGEIYYVNPAWEYLTGYTSKEVKGKNPRFLSSSKTPKRVHKKLWTSLINGLSFSTNEIYNKKKDGTEYEIYSTFFPIRKNSKNIFYVQYLHEITPLKKYQRVLEEKDKQLRVITENVEDHAIFSIDKNGYITSWSIGCEKVKGYKASEIIGKHFSIFYKQVDRKKNIPHENLEKALKDGRNEYQGWRVKKDKTLFWADIVITAIKDKKGKVVGFVKVVRDTSKKKEFDDELRFHDQILISMADGVSIIKTQDNTFVYANPAFEKMYGYSTGELVDKQVSIVNLPLNKFSRKKTNEINKKLKKDGVWTGERLNIKKDGTRFWCLVNISAFQHYKFGQVRIEVHQDISERKEFERQKDAFIGIASHELKTPITTLSVYSQILEKRLEKDKKNIYFIENIKAQTKRLTGLIDDLLNVSKIDSGRLELNLKSFDLNAEINKIIVDFQFTTETHEITKEGSISKNVIGDVNRIEQVIINLLTNAIKYSPKANKVVIHLSNNKTMATIAIQDFGLGIAKIDQPHLFERFYRTKDKEEGKISGFGLGLYISSKIVKQHKGNIWVESEKGKGSKFFFTLHLAK